MIISQILVIVRCYDCYYCILLLLLLLIPLQKPKIITHFSCLNVWGILRLISGWSHSQAIPQRISKAITQMFRRFGRYRMVQGGVWQFQISYIFTWCFSQVNISHAGDLLKTISSHVGDIEQIEGASLFLVTQKLEESLVVDVWDSSHGWDVRNEAWRVWLLRKMKNVYDLDASHMLYRLEWLEVFDSLFD